MERNSAVVASESSVRCQFEMSFVIVLVIWVCRVGEMMKEAGVEDMPGLAERNGMG